MRDLVYVRVHKLSNASHNYMAKLEPSIKVLTKC